jgi:hypothetical protein
MCGEQKMSNDTVKLPPTEVSFNKVVPKNQGMLLHFGRGEIKKLKLKPDDVVRVTVKIIHREVI